MGIWGLILTLVMFFAFVGLLVFWAIPAAKENAE